MRRHRFRGMQPRQNRPSINGVVWMIGLAVLFYTNWWWPGILILVAISILLSSRWRGSTEPEPSLPGNEPFFCGKKPVQQPAVVKTAPMITPPSEPTPTQRIDLLPNTCPQCGAPVRTGDVSWTGAQSIACSYCGSNILVLKNSIKY